MSAARRGILYFGLAIVTAISLVPKIAFDRWGALAGYNDQIMASVRSAVLEHDYQLIETGDARVIAAYHDGCGAWIGLGNAVGGLDELFAQQYGAFGTVAFWYRGEIHASRPALGAMWDLYWQRLRMSVGQAPVFFPLYNISYTPTCKPSQLAFLPATFQVQK